MCPVEIPFVMKNVGILIPLVDWENRKKVWRINGMCEWHLLVCKQKLYLY